MTLSTQEIKIIAEGPVGSGKSALLGEIEILCKALGVPVRYANPSDAASEKSMTHADWTAYLEMYKPSVVLHEQGPIRPTPPASAQDDAKDEQAASFNPEDCNKEVYERGTYVGLFDIPKHVANELCAGISAATGARVDWHYFGGRVRVMALPAALVTDRFRAAYMEWQEKTDFIQERIASGDLPVKYLGWHRADVMRDLIDAAIATRQQGDA